MAQFYNAELPKVLQSHNVFKGFYEFSAPLKIWLSWMTATTF